MHVHTDEYYNGDMMNFEKIPFTKFMRSRR